MSDSIASLHQRIDLLAKILEQTLTNTNEFGNPSKLLSNSFNLDPQNGYYVEEIKKIIEDYIQINKINTFSCMFEKNDKGFFPDKHLLSVFKANRCYQGLPAITWDKVHTEILSNLSKSEAILSRPEQLEYVKNLLK